MIYILDLSHIYNVYFAINLVFIFNVVYRYLPIFMEIKYNS